MSNEHISAAIACGEFKGMARILLFVLADACSNGNKKRNDGGLNLPLGWTSRGIPALMRACNCLRRQTIMDALNELVEAGAIKRARRKNRAALTFVNLKWLREHKSDIAEYVAAYEKSGGLRYTDENATTVEGGENGLNYTKTEFFAEDDDCRRPTTESATLPVSPAAKPPYVGRRRKCRKTGCIAMACPSGTGMCSYHDSLHTCINEQPSIPVFEREPDPGEAIPASAAAERSEAGI